MAFPTNWGRYCALTIDNTNVDSDLTDFPVLLTEDTLPSEMFDSDGSYPALSGGGDIRFSTDAVGATRLPCEIVTFTIDPDPANGVAEIWVKVPSVTSASTTTIYVWYNKTGETQPAVGDTYGRNAVWSDYDMVTHAVSTDSTGNFTITQQGTPSSTTGMIGNGLSLSTSGDRAEVSNAGETTGSFTLQMIHDRTAVGSTAETYIGRRSGGSWNWQWRYNLATSRPSLLLGSAAVDATNNLGTGFDWIAVAYDGTDIKHYKNGAANGSGARSGTVTAPGGITTSIGSESGASSNHQDYADVDEVRIRLDELSADWLKAEYYNQSDPATFVTEGTPADGPTGSEGSILTPRSRLIGF